MAPFVSGSTPISVGIPVLFKNLPAPTARSLRGIRVYAKGVLYEGGLAHTLSLYMFLLVALAVEAILIA